MLQVFSGHRRGAPIISEKPNKTMRVAIPLGYFAIAFSAIILLADGANRLSIMLQDSPPTDVFDLRYVQHPWITFLHIVPGLMFLTLGPLQFMARIRQRRISFHRGLGRILVVCAATSGLIALVVNVVFPTFGGISGQAATVFFGAIFLFSLTKAVCHIRRKEVRLHREWMIRAFALAMGVASIRVFIILFRDVSGLELVEAFGTSFWLGFSVNLLVAEVWINHTRRASQVTNRS